MVGRGRTKGLFDEETTLWMQHKKKDVTFHTDYDKWRTYWHEAGPTRFALEVLKIDPNTGKPLVLSNGQKEFLDDSHKGIYRLIIIAAGRGSGKTFVLACYIMWRIYTHDNWSIACMGGSAEQSDKIAFYISGWIRNTPILEQYTLKNLKKETITYSGGNASFHACSGTSVRGPHTTELIIDEQAAGEEKGGGRFIQAALYDVSTSPDIRVIQSSTAQFIHGDFLKTWNDAEKMGYKRYCWSIAKHISGNIDPYAVYKDQNPKHWKSNIPWIPDINIEILRKKAGDDEWLVEALGGISMSSGLVLNPEDFKSCLCDGKGMCNEGCNPYKERYCPIIQYIVNVMEGYPNVPISTLQCIRTFIKERVMGIDWGRGSPCAYVVLGKFKDWVFVLDAVEVTGLTDMERIEQADTLAKKWDIDIIRPDPREWTLNGMLAEKGYSIHELFSFTGGNEKYEYLGTLKKYVERHQLIIPKVFEDLIRSLRMLSYDDDGKIRKVDDHSSDAMIYAISFYGEVDSESALWELAPEQRGLKSFW